MRCLDTRDLVDDKGDFDMALLRKMSRGREPVQVLASGRVFETVAARLLCRRSSRGCARVRCTIAVTD